MFSNNYIMADPLSLALVIGLACLGKKLSEKKETFVDNVLPHPQTQQVDEESEDFSFSGSRTGQRKEILDNMGDMQKQNVYGFSTTNDERARAMPYFKKIMNNFSPVEKQLVGPGLGIGPDVPAYGGYQQLYRVLPTNVGAYKLSELPGRSGPAMDVTGGKSGLIGDVTHHMPEKTTFLPSRHPNVKGRAQSSNGGANTAMTYRGSQEKTKRQTNRSQITQRCDGLEFNPAKSITSALTLAQAPTRNKGDMTTGAYSYSDQPSPGITTFSSGYTQSPAVKMLENEYINPENGYTTKQLEKYGFRPDDRRGKEERAGNAGRMNVQGTPVNQNGMISTVRTENNNDKCRTGAANGGWTQNYVKPEYNQSNPYKGVENTWGASNTGLNIGRNQLKNNPLALSISG